jgi:hypothetical protein
MLHGTKRPRYAIRGTLDRVPELTNVAVVLCFSAWLRGRVKIQSSPTTALQVPLGKSFQRQFRQARFQPLCNPLDVYPNRQNQAQREGTT